MPSVSAALVSESTRKRYDQPPRLAGESVLVIGDAQAPYHDAVLINQVRRVAFAWGIRSCIWAGDMADMAVFSIFMNESTDAEMELDETHLALAEMASGFDCITWLMGNHEARFRNAINRYLSLERVRMLLGLDAKIATSDYYWGLVGSDWRISHPKNTSVVPARVAQQLAEKFQRNVAQFHNHLTGLMPTRDGRHIGVEVGICADPKRMEYVQTRDNTRPVMQQGALILRWDGAQYWPHLLSPLWTDWDYEIWQAKQAKYRPAPIKNTRGWE